MSELHILEDAGRHDLVVELDGIPAGDARHACVHKLFTAQVQQTPDAIALVCGDDELTYEELNARANRLAHHLVSQGVGPETLVGICLERGVELVVGLLAILKAGGAYLPLDPDYPRERLAFMLDDSAAAVLVTRSALESLPASGATTVLMDSDGDAIAARPATDPEPTTTPGNLAYVIYTSGSTGTPKGVMVPHANVVRLFSATAADFAFDSSDVWTLFHSYAFDFSVWELWGALLHGGRLVVVPKMAARSPEALVELVRAHGVTVLNQTPSAFRQLMHAEAASPRDELPLRFVVFGGEALEPSSLGPWIERHGVDAPRLVNMYGITETTVHVTRRVLHEADAATTASPIGRPIPDLDAYILDRYGNPVPQGVAGELYVGGAGLARGYLNRPALTAERFVPDPFAQTAGARLYRTGDRARYLKDGNLEYLGRVDHQVKIRGFRIEPGEIEAALSRHEVVRDAVVVARSDNGSDKRLVAYVTTLGSSSPPGPPELRAQLLDTLPDYMVPAAIVILDELPLTPNGKLDRAALPAPEDRPELESAYIAPRTQTEEILAGIWAEVLGLPRVGVQDDFFELGGHSLMATEMGSRARRALGVPLSSTEIFGKPTIALLAREIDSLRNQDQCPLLPPVERSGSEMTAPLSLQQETCWYHSKLAPESIAYQAQTTIRVAGPFDVGVFERAVTEIAARHEIIRTTYREVEGRGEQIVHPRAPKMVSQIDLSTLSPDERIARLDDLVHEELRRPFDLTRLPMMRWTVVRLAPEEHEIILVEHHLVHDGFSFTLLMRELSVLYTAFARGQESPLEELPAQYRDYARWQRKALELAGMQAQRAAWSEQLADVSRVVELPTEQKRPAVQRFSGNTIRVDLSPDLPAALRAFCLAEGVTPFMAMLSAFTVLLHRYAGESDVTVVSGYANRNVGNTDRLIGMFVNPVLLRCNLDGDPSFQALLRQVRGVVLHAMRNQEFPFSELVRMLNPVRVAGRNPLLDVMFSFHDASLPEVDFAGSPGTVFERANGSAKTDLNVIVIPGAHSRRGDDGRISLLWEYNADLFSEAFIRDMASHLDNLLRTAIVDPARSVSQLDMLAEPERHHLTVELNDTAAAYPQDACVHELFSAQAEKTPDAVALVAGDREFSYQKLNESANRLAHHLVSLGVGPETLVGICLERGVDSVVGLLAILKAGGAYVPLDPDYPTERLAFMLEDTGAPVLVTSSELRDRLPKGNATPVLVDSDEDAIAAQPATDPEPAATPDHLAYVIYTSGSTGTPKGVAVAHGGVVNYLTWCMGNYDVGAGRGAPLHSSVAFDLTVTSLFAPLVAGSAVIVLPERHEENPLRQELETEGRFSFVKLTPAHLDNLGRVLNPDAMAQCASTVLVGGEALTAAAVSQWVEHSEARLINEYGPTEATVGCTIYEIGPDDIGADSIPIGRPIANTQVYLLDAHYNPAPKGVAGELYIGGAGLARGYLNRPALTAERFVPDPFSQTEGARLYRTGDRARYLKDGNIEFLGRVDHQVKIRGFRIEPGEIEAALTRHHALTDAVVLARADDGTDKRLVGYVTALDSSNPPGPPELRAHLLETLPDYMVPAHFVVLDELPLTPNGKLDRKALPAPEGRPELESAYVAPRTATEEILAGIWAELLGLERVGVNDNFFELGGHSLVATQVVARLRTALCVELPLTALFEARTVAALAKRVARSDEQPEAPPITPVDRTQDLELSYAQQRLWFLDKLEPDSPQYNISQALRIRGLEREALERALSAIVARHESLRTTFATIDGRPVQVIAPPAPLHLELVDLSSLPADERDAETARVVAEEAERPFDLEQGPLLRATLVAVGVDDLVLVLVMHHIVSDGWSIGVFTRELSAFYDACSNGPTPDLEPLPIHYADYAAWQRNWLQDDVLDNQLAYWKEQLAGLAPVLELPTDHPRPAVRRGRGAIHRLALDQYTLGTLRDLSRSHNATMFMTLVAAFNVLLARYSGHDDIAVGTPIAGRTHAELEDLIGFFVNTLVLRTDLSGDPSFSELVARVRGVALGAYAHQDVPFEKLVEELQPERSLSHTPLFQVMFTVEGASGGDLELADASVSPFPVGTQTAKFDLTLSIVDDDSTVAAVIEYDADLFTPDTIARMGNHLSTLLNAVAAAPDRPLSELDMLAEPERHHLTFELNDTATDYPQGACVHELFSAQVQETPNAVALVAGDQELSYQELNAAANRLAHHLVSLGVGPDTPVGICVPRGADMVVGLLAILKAGGAYVPLDPDYPQERLAFMLQDTGASVLVTSSDLLADLPANNAALVLVDSDEDAIAAQPATDPEPAATPDHLAYVIYTSGSTGTPKGVAVGHRAITRLVCNTDYVHLTPEHRVAQASKSAFDAMTFELWGALLSGAALVVCDEGTLLSPELFGDFLRRERVTTLFVTTALFNQIVSHDPSIFAPLEHLLFGGEACDPNRVSRLLEETSFTGLRHVYGPTESTTFASWCPVDASVVGDTVPIGRPIANTQIYLLDRRLNPVPQGVPGELYIGGAGLARGYLNRPALTAERFVPDPFSKTEGARLYRTGDRARYLKDGNIEFLGRVDRQLKIRGFRIEPGEIEAALTRHQAISDAVVLARADEGTDKRLVAYLVATGEAPTTTELRAHLLEMLPDYMVPSHVVVLDELPLTPNGKLDRNALPAPEGRPELESVYVAPRTPTEEILASIWQQVLGLERVGVQDNFFELGGHSLAGTQVMSRVWSRLGIEVGVRILFEARTVASLAQIVDELIFEEIESLSEADAVGALATLSPESADSGDVA